MCASGRVFLPLGPLSLRVCLGCVLGGAIGISSDEGWVILYFCLQGHMCLSDRFHVFHHPGDDGPCVQAGVSVPVSLHAVVVFLCLSMYGLPIKACQVQIYKRVLLNF